MITEREAQSVRLTVYAVMEKLAAMPQQSQAPVFSSKMQSVAPKPGPEVIERAQDAAEAYRAEKGRHELGVLSGRGARARLHRLADLARSHRKRAIEAGVPLETYPSLDRAMTSLDFRDLYSRDRHPSNVPPEWKRR